MSTWLVERRLRSTSRRLGELREELRITNDQLQHLAEEADDLGLRAMVSETPSAVFEHRHASAHAEAMLRHRNYLVQSIAEHEARIDELLEKMQAER